MSSNKAKISLTFNIPKTIKINADGTVNILVKCSGSSVPKGLKDLGETIYNIGIGSKQWKKVTDNICEDTRVFMNGELKASVNAKGTPFIHVNCFEIGIVEPKEVPTASDKVEPIKEKKPIQVQTKAEILSRDQKKNELKQISGAAIQNFRLHHESVMIPLNKIMLTSTIHRKSANFLFHLGDLDKAKKNIRPLIIRTLEDGNYKLLIGLSDYAACKLLDIETVPALITDLSYDELVKTWSIESFHE